jgi:hypothetical protein
MLAAAPWGGRADGQMRARGPQPGAVAGVVAARTTAVHAGGKISVPAGLYARVSVAVLGGARHAAGAWSASGRADAIARFHVDPFGQSRVGAYAGGGASLFFDDGARRRVRLVAVIGFEGPLSARGWVPGIELGLGGGARVGVTLRRSRNGVR